MEMYVFDFCNAICSKNVLYFYGGSNKWKKKSIHHWTTVERVEEC